MTEWLIALGVFVALLALMVSLLRRVRPRKGAGGGFVVALGMVLASVYDPAKAAATEQLDRRKETEGSEEGESGEKP